MGGLNLVAGNTYGLYVTIAGPPGNDDIDHQLLYTNGSNTYTNADLKITTGIGVAYPFGSGGIFPSRTWNGTIFYTPAAVPEPGSIALLTGLRVLGALLRLANRPTKPPNRLPHTHGRGLHAHQPQGTLEQRFCG